MKKYIGLNFDDYDINKEILGNDSLDNSFKNLDEKSRVSMIWKHLKE